MYKSMVFDIHNGNMEKLDEWLNEQKKNGFKLAGHEYKVFQSHAGTVLEKVLVFVEKVDEVKPKACCTEVKITGVSEADKIAEQITKNLKDTKGKSKKGDENEKGK